MSPNAKISSLELLATRLAELRELGKRIILCHGVFDLLHIGHIRYLRQAKDLGDVLVVTLTPDRFVDKGPHRPAFSETLRAEALASLDCVDFVAVNMWSTAEETLRLLRPNIYAKGAEFKNLEDTTGKIQREAAVAEAAGVEIVFVEDIVFSSSTLINRYFSTFSTDCRDYLELLRKRFSIADIQDSLSSFGGITALVVGDTILDEYVYCSGLGASSKDPVLALLCKSRELYAGGAAAVANHVAQHVERVIFCTVVGDDGKEDFIRSHLAPNVEMHAVVRPTTPTLRKERMVEGYSLQKLLELYHMDRTPLSEAQEKELAERVKTAMSRAEMVIAADFGHGCITESLVRTLCAGPLFLAVNTQANAGNRGYHTIGRYGRADFVSLASHEITLQYRNSNMHLREMMEDLAARLHVRQLVVTEGRNGCAALSEKGFIRAPSFTSSVVDRVGAGDALFSVAALAAYRNLPLELIPFLGNIAGSLAVEIVGNARAVSNTAMQRYLTALMK